MKHDFIKNSDVERVIKKDSCLERRWAHWLSRECQEGGFRINGCKMLYRRYWDFMWKEIENTMRFFLLCGRCPLIWRFKWTKMEIHNARACVCNIIKSVRVRASARAAFISKWIPLFSELVLQYSSYTWLSVKYCFYAGAFNNTSNCTDSFQCTAIIGLPYWANVSFNLHRVFLTILHSKKDVCLRYWYT